MPNPADYVATLAEMAKVALTVDDKMKLVEASAALNEVLGENRRLMDENSELRTKLAYRKALELRDGSYYIIGDDGGEIGPICPQCYQDRGLAYLLERDNGGARCSVCRTRYAGSKYAVEGYRQGIL